MATTTYEIYPAIGIARLGNSDKYFLAPEPAVPATAYYQSAALPRPASTGPQLRDGSGPLDKFRDAGALKRQAVRFRVFECTRDDNTKQLTGARELAPNTATIEWTIHLANRKAEGPRFIPVQNKPRRNHGYAPRNGLVIDGQRQPLPAAGVAHTTIAGAFKGNPVEIAEAWVENDRRLYVCAAQGESRSPSNAAIGTFADNDDWYDRTCDGPVFAKVTIGNNQFDATPAWVIVAPFDFAPHLASYITLYDVTYQAAAAKFHWPAPGPYQTDFERDIHPILKRVRGYRWIHGPSMRAETQDRHTAWRDKLGIMADPNPINVEGAKWRKAMFAHLPDPADPDDAAKQKREVKMPRLFNHNYEFDPRGVGKTLPLTPIQYAHFRNWADGKFISGAPVENEFLCDALTRVALEACSGGAFYPGMEAPRIMRGPAQDPNQPDIYRDENTLPMRIDPQKVQPGGITQGLAVPWQADFYECQMERDNAWWPATRPDHVLLSEPARAVDSQSEDMKRWDAGVADKKDMVNHWHQLGIVKKTPAQQANPQKMGADAEVDPVAGIMKYYFYLEDERDKQNFPRP